MSGLMSRNTLCKLPLLIETGDAIYYPENLLFVALSQHRGMNPILLKSGRRVSLLKTVGDRDLCIVGILVQFFPTSL